VEESGHNFDLVGKPTIGTEVKVSEFGEILVRSKQFADMVLDHNLNDIFLKNSNEFYSTGDRGLIVEEGLVFQGRISEIINVGGLKVFPLEIENVVSSIPGVDSSIAAGVPNNDLGEVVGILIVRDPDSKLDEHQIKRFCIEKLEPFKIPRIIKFSQHIPLTESGKPDRSFATKVLAHVDK
jgi:long-chain acyl-CoA synthetase